MAELVRYILLGLLQGATEFLPLSSSGHLVAARAFMSVQAPRLVLEVCLHFGTLLAILIVFRRQVRDLVVDGAKGCHLLLRRRSWEEVRRSAPQFRMVVAIVVGTLPAAGVGLCLHGAIESMFGQSPGVVGVLMVVTGLVLWASRDVQRGSVRATGPLQGLLVGGAQALALLPGLSRSGLTIVAGYVVGLERSLAARFSFLLAVPALGGAMILEAGRALAGHGAPVPAGVGSAGGAVLGIVCGTAVAALSGVVCLALLLKVIEKGKLHWFGAYCVPAGLLLVAFECFA